MVKVQGQAERIKELKAKEEEFRSEVNEEAVRKDDSADDEEEKKDAEKMERTTDKEKEEISVVDGLFHCFYYNILSKCSWYLSMTCHKNYEYS